MKITPVKIAVLTMEVAVKNPSAKMMKKVHFVSVMKMGTTN